MSEDFSLENALTVVRRHLVLVVLVGAIVGFVVLVVSLVQTERYQATARLLYAPPLAATESPERVLETMAAVVPTQEVLAEALPDSGFETTAELREGLEVDTNANADLLTITVSATSAEAAAAGANSVAAALIAMRDDKDRELTNARIEFLQNQLAALAGKTSPSEVAAAADLRTQLAAAQAQLAVPSPDLTVVEPAVPPSSSYTPRPYRNGLIGVLAGLVLGAGLALARDRLDRRLRSVEDVEDIYGCPALGVVPYQETAQRQRKAALGDFTRRSPIAEAFRTVRTNLSLFRLDEGEPGVIVISSAVDSEGKSSATANLAVALAASGRRVLAIGGDAHSPSLKEYFDAPEGNEGEEEEAESNGAEGKKKAPPPRRSQLNGLFGMADVLAGVVPLDKAVSSIHLDGAVVRPGGSLDVLAPSRRFHDPAVLYQSGAMKGLLAQARKQFDVVIVDSPPLLAGGESAALAQHADALLLVASVDRLTRNGARRAARLLEAAHLSPVGLIVTGRRLNTEEGSYGYGDDDRN